MKNTIQIRTSDFEYIMQEFEGTPEEAVDAFKALKGAWTGGTGLPEKDFNHCLDTYMTTGTLNGGTELYHQMNEKQQYVFQSLKKAFKRIKSKQGENEIE